MKRFLCPTDFSDASQAAEAEAQRLAAALGAEVVLLHVMTEAPLWTESIRAAKVRKVFENQRAWANAALATRVTALTAAGVPARALVTTGLAWEEILRAAREEQADAIVMGTHGRTGLDRMLLGSVAESVVRRSDCPVLTVRPAQRRRKGAA
jgi:nucleotide-binding universal stress UspA family protein